MPTIGPLELLLIVVVVGALLAWLAVKLVRRSGSRPCPRCGERVKVGEMRCTSCGFDFNTIGGERAEGNPAA